ncbi:MAG: AMP-binding protein, partial [bacterium]|nr:AMP-binding protein [bacterium]
MNTIPIGRALTETALYVLNRYNYLQPVGVAGELCIAGNGLSRGYLNRPELTTEKFIEIPLETPTKPATQRTSKNNLIRIYKTGDLCRLLPGGDIEFLGRIDLQVKIRGFRIELGEIESRLLSHPEIKETVVIAGTAGEAGNNTLLCAYYVENNTGHPESAIQNPQDDLEDFLSQFLPDYMIPSSFIKLEKIPLTPNGKIDRKTLAKIQISNFEYRTYTAPRNETEKKVTAIWAETLEMQKTKISIDEDFFNIGGHSLRATTVAARIHKELKVKLPLEEIFKNSTIRTLAGILKEYGKEKFDTIKPVEKKEYYPQSSAQKRLYVLQQMELESTVYNMPSTTPLGDRVNLERLEIICRKLIQRHESLRTSFHMIDENPV